MQESIESPVQEVIPPPKKSWGRPFEKGHAKIGGRVKGVPNKVNVTIAEAILMAAERSGYDKNGKDGVDGYLKRLADDLPVVFAQLLLRVMPVQLSGRLDVHTNQNTMYTVDEAKAELRDRGIPVNQLFLGPPVPPIISPPEQQPSE